MREQRGGFQRPHIGGGGRGGGGGGGGGDGGEGEARKLTTKLAKAEPAAAILSLVDKEVDGSIFNYFHMAATLNRLAWFSQRRQLSPSDVASTVWPRLVTRLRAMLKDGLLPARATAQVLWAIGELHDALYGKVEGYDRQLLLEVMRHTQRQAAATEPQGLSNSLLTLAREGVAMPDVCSTVKSIAHHMLKQVAGMKPQELSNSLWAAAKLQDAAPQVLTAVPAIAERIPRKVEGMTPQELSNSLWAVAKLITNPVNK